MLNSITKQHVKMLYHGFRAFYASLFATEIEKLLLNNNIRASCRTNMSSKQNIKRYKQQKSSRFQKPQ